MPDYQRFEDFWPYYVTEHKKSLTRRLHFIGTTLVLLIFFGALLCGQPKLLWLMPVCGYGFAWVGHFFVERNRPATFRYPFFSLWADFVMYKKMWLGQMDRDVERYAGPASS